MGALIRVAPDAPRRDPGGPGTPEAVWVEGALERLPVAYAEMLVPPGARLVVIAPHPDDEVLGTGGLIATLAALGRAPLVVGVTDGEASHPGSTRWTRVALACERVDEAREGLARLGLRAPPRLALGLPDGGVAKQEDVLLGALREVLRPTDVVFTTSSIDGHPDHEATARAALSAAGEVGAAAWEVPIWTWHWSWPKDPRVAWDRAVLLPLDPEATAAKRAAIAAHRTQLHVDPSTGRGAVLPPEDLAHFERSFEIFFRPLASREPPSPR